MIAVERIVLKVTTMTPVGRLAEDTVALLDGTPEIVVIWHTGPEWSPTFNIADRAARQIMKRRRSSTTLDLRTPFDGMFRITNAPRLFELDGAA